MKLNKRLNEFYNTLYPEPIPVGRRTYGIAFTYLFSGFLFILIGIILDYFTKNHIAYSLNIKLLFISFIFNCVLLISWLLIRNNFRAFLNRIIPYILHFLDYILLIYFFSNTISLGNQKFFIIILVSSLGYIILNFLFQLLVIDFYRGKSKDNVQKNVMYIPFGMLCAIGTFMSIWGTIFQEYSYLFTYVMLLIITIFYQTVVFEFILVNKGEKLYQEQMKKSRYGESVSSLLKNKGK
ncbi:TPA: hypothetical protein ACGAW8_000167 [Streptococcus agalactiae]